MSAWLLILLGFIGGRTWSHLRAGGVLDLRECLALGEHRTPNRAGVCPRCRTRLIMVAP